jgi:hypothetical protein
MTDPELLRVRFEADVDESEGEEEEDGEGADDYDCTVVVVEPAQLLEDEFKVH